MASSPTTKPKSSSFVDKFKGNKVFFGIAIALAVAAAGVVLFILSSLVATTKYYVLNTDVPARSEITSSMLTEVVTSEGGEPRNALTLSEVLSKPTYAKYALNAGDTLTQSNTGDKSPLTAGIPDSFTIMSITVDPQNAVAGKIAAGDYIDIVATEPNGQLAKLVMRHILVTDAMTDPSQVAASGESTGDEAVEDSEAVVDEAASTEDNLRNGIPVMYTVAVSPEDAAKLQLLTRGADGTAISVVLSPNENREGVTNDSVYASLGDLFNSENPVGDSGKGTDSTFGQGGNQVDEDSASTESGSTGDSTSGPSPSASSDD